MLRSIRKRVTYANVILTIALVFLATGGAYAAGRYVVTSTKQISPKVLKQLTGKAGKTGSTGAIGAVGPAGSPGPVGPQGSPGAKGETGKEGVAGPKGEAGTKGDTGEPWTAGGTLPTGSSESGQWAVGGFEKAGTIVSTGISFGIPLAAAPGASHAHLIGLEEGEGEVNEAAAIKSGECKGNFESEPRAASGNLCVFVTGMSNLKAASGGLLNNEGGLLPGAGKTGTSLFFLAEFSAPETEGSSLARGVWVVTG